METDSLDDVIPDQLEDIEEGLKEIEDDLMQNFGTQEEFSPSSSPNHRVLQN